MQVADMTEPRALAAPPGHERVLCGWGRTAPSRCLVIEPRNADDVLAALTSPWAPARGVIARGAGRSYGDAAQNEGGVVLDTTGLDRVVSIDFEHGLVTAQAGASFARVMAALAPYGLTLPVVPGTRHVTVAGAIASDVHGKNHHRDGALARHVSEIWLCTPGQGQLEVTADDEPDLFYATLGGMGLTGVIVQATLRTEPLRSAWVSADVERSDTLARTLDLMAAPERHRYSVAWLDLLAHGRDFGRGIVSRADPIAPPDPSEDWTLAASPSERPRLSVPAGFPGGLLNPTSVRTFNAMRWRASPRSAQERRLARVPYLFPLDAVGEWSRLYGHGGLVQYQIALPTGQELALERCFDLIARRRLPVYLAVFKRFGAAFGGPLSFPLDGWTLAIDLPAATPGLHGSLAELDELVADAGGRVYLSKDSRLRRDALRAMYPQLARFAEQRATIDPDGVLRSDLAVRLGLCGASQ